MRIFGSASRSRRARTRAVWGAVIFIAGGLLFLTFHFGERVRKAAMDRLSTPSQLSSTTNSDAGQSPSVAE